MHLLLNPAPQRISVTAKMPEKKTWNKINLEKTEMKCAACAP
jgi:hypothetical protein